MLARDFRDQGSARGTWERLARITFLWHSATNPSGPACGRPAHPKVWMIALKATCLKPRRRVRRFTFQLTLGALLDSESAQA